MRVPDKTGPSVEVGLWYPTAAPGRPTEIGLLTANVARDAAPSGHSLPLVVISHGHGGDFSSHLDTAIALAEAGFVVAAPTHTGDNWRDDSRALDIGGRVRTLSSVIDWVSSTWRPGVVDPSRIGAFGFSSGGLTVLIAAGGEPDLSRIGPHCRMHPEFYDCRIIDAHRSGAPVSSAGWQHDGRIRAIVVAAPALGFTFGQQRLRAVTMPVQLWRAGADRGRPAPESAHAVRDGLPSAPDFHVVPRAGHYDFLAPCTDALAHAVPEICSSEPGFDRIRFHRAFDRAVTGFFRQAIGASPRSASGGLMLEHAARLTAPAASRR